MDESICRTEFDSAPDFRQVVEEPAQLLDVALPAYQARRFGGSDITAAATRNPIGDPRSPTVFAVPPQSSALSSVRRLQHCFG